MTDPLDCCCCLTLLGTHGGPSTLPCGHNGCKDCLNAIQRASSGEHALCPLCRAPFGASTQLAVNHDLQGLLKHLSQKSQDGMRLQSKPNDTPTKSTSISSAVIGSALGPWTYISRAPRPVWVPDSIAVVCMVQGCLQQFSLLNPRHHCRMCGRLVCAACSKDRLMLPPRFGATEPQRVCAACSPLLQPFQRQLASTMACASQVLVHDAVDKASWRAFLRVPMASRLEPDILIAASILRGVASATSLVPQLKLTSCSGVAILNMLRVGVGCSSCAAGTGLVIARRNGMWGWPSAVIAASGTIGVEYGAVQSHLIIVLNKERDLKALTIPSIGFGARGGVVAGHIGREGARVWRLGGTGPRIFSLTRGVFAGVALEGMVLCPRNSANRKFYGLQHLHARTLLTSHDVFPPPPACAPLYAALDAILALEDSNSC